MEAPEEDRMSDYDVLGSYLSHPQTHEIYLSFFGSHQQMWYVFIVDWIPYYHDSQLSFLLQWIL